MITSTSNVQIKEITALLKKSKERKEKKAFVIEGRKMFEEICQDKSRVVKAYFSESYVKEQYSGKNCRRCLMKVWRIRYLMPWQKQ